MPQPTQPTLEISDSPESAAAKCASFILKELSERLAATKKATLAISGGTTPRLLFADFAKASSDWSGVHVFWVDERCVPPTDSQSNFKLANDAWFTPSHFPVSNIHRIQGELDPVEGGRKYAEDIKKFFQIIDADVPVFDVIHRGMGPDAHTASLFPGEPLIQNRSGIATNVWVEKFKMHRVTMLPAVLLKARRTVLQVSGPDKADAVKTVIEGPENWMEYPCQIASRDLHATWFLDRAAAAKL